MLDGAAFKPGSYELTFHVGDYFRGRARRSPIRRSSMSSRCALRIAEDTHYHVPLLGLAVRLLDLPGELMDVFLGEWLNLLLRWAHMVVGIGWIGTSFYFMALDYTLLKRERMNPGVLWHVLAGARRRLLSRREICGGAGDAAGRAALVQVGGLSHLGHRFRPADRAVLRSRPSVPDRSRGDAAHRLAGDRDLGRVARGRLVHL